MARSILSILAAGAVLAACQAPDSTPAGPTVDAVVEPEAGGGAAAGAVPSGPASDSRDGDDGHDGHRGNTVPRGPYVRVIGSVQDGGFPHAACLHDACRRARDEGWRRYVSSLAVVLPRSGQVFLIDASPDLRRQLDLLDDVRRPPPDRVDRAPVDGVFLTHAHIGHYLGLAFFGFEAVHTRDLPVYATPRMADYLRSNGPWSQLVDIGNIDLHELEAGDRMDIGRGDGDGDDGARGVRVMAIRSPHRDEYSDTVGFVIEGPERSVLYLPDTDSWAAWDASLDSLLAEVDVALLDGTFYSPAELPGREISSIGHPLISDSIERLGELARSGRTRILFTHLNHSNPALLPDSEALAAIRQAGFDVAVEGQEFDL